MPPKNLMRSGLGGISEQGDVLRRPGERLVGDVLWHPNYARLDGLSVGGGPGRGRAEAHDNCAPVHGRLHR